MRTYLTESLLSEIEDFRSNLQSGLSVQPALSLSIKTSWRNYLDEEEDLLLVAQVDRHTGDLPPAEHWSALRMDAIEVVLRAPDIAPRDLEQALVSSCLNPICSHPPFSALLHVALPHKFACITNPLSLIAAFCLTDADSLLADWFEGVAAIVPFIPNLLELCIEMRKASSGGLGLILLNRGLLTFGESLEACLDQQNRLSQIACEHLPASVQHSEATTENERVFEVLPNLRAQVCAGVGHPLLLSLDDSEGALAFLDDARILEAVKQGSALPDFLICTRFPTEIKNGFAENVECLSLQCPAWVDESSRVLLNQDLGIVTAGDSYAETQHTASVFNTMVAAIQATQKSGCYRNLPLADLEAALRWVPTEMIERKPFSGEVALVTGAASGIGRACVASFLRRGSAVVGIDINPTIQQTFDHPSYLGLVCDVTDEATVHKSLIQTVRRFGGLDMLVLNAGLFPPSCYIRSLPLADFTRVLNVNLNANLLIMREAHPLLSMAPCYGRVVIIGSKNTRAPGPGAAAYSASKAALTQLARVAALEWSSERIRVNVIHPDSVFDTGLYTAEILEARANHYGMTVEEYKKRNLLKTEITSLDVGEMVAEMCGPLFRSVTGAQLQMDGGNERTI